MPTFPLVYCSRNNLTTFVPFAFRRILKQEPDNLRFQSREKVFEDEATVGDQEIENDHIIYCTFRRGEGDAWEEIDVAPAGGTAEPGASEKK